MRTLSLFAFAILFVFAVACSSPGRTAAWEKERRDLSGATTSSAAAASLTEKAKGHWDKRDERTELKKAIATWEELVNQDPQNASALASLARAYYFLGDGFLALDANVSAEDELAVYTKGVDYGEAALMILEPEFEKTMRNEGEFEDAISKIGTEGMSAAYWYCANLGRFASKKGLSERLFYKDKLKAAMERVMSLDPKFFYGAADRYFGAFYSILPGIAGKDVPRSKRHFETSVKLAPEYLPTKVVQAQFLAPELDDEAMFKRLLDEVLKGDDTDNPDIAPENRAAKRTAKKMLTEVDEYF